MYGGIPRARFPRCGCRWKKSATGQTLAPKAYVTHYLLFSPFCDTIPDRSNIREEGLISSTALEQSACHLSRHDQRQACPQWPLTTARAHAPKRFYNLPTVPPDGDRVFRHINLWGQYHYNRWGGFEYYYSIICVLGGREYCYSIICVLGRCITIPLSVC